jgi:hypothetical protein
MRRKNPPPIANLAQHAVDHLHITKTLTAKTGPDTIGWSWLASAAAIPAATNAVARTAGGATFSRRHL